MNFINALNAYNAIRNGAPGSDLERHYADILRAIDRPGRRRRYLASTSEPSIDGYIDWCYAEKVAKR